MIWNHLNTLIPKQDSFSNQVKKDDGKTSGDKELTGIKVESIATNEFGYRCFGLYETLLDLHDLKEKGIKLSDRLKYTEDEVAKAKIKTQLNKILNKAEELKAYYIKRTPNNCCDKTVNLDIKAAYVTFRYMEGYMRTRTMFTNGRLKRCCWWFTCQQKKYREYYLNGKYPNVKAALDP